MNIPSSSLPNKIPTPIHTLEEKNPCLEISYWKTEATEALKHALEDENNPIIAFRANAEKYRKMMQEK